MSKEYKNHSLKIYTDFSHAAEEEAKYIANQNPVDRIKDTVQLILRMYSLSPKKPNTNIIYFDKE